MMMEEETLANYIHAEPKFMNTLIAKNYNTGTDIVVRSILKQSSAEQMILILISQSLKIHVCYR